MNGVITLGEMRAKATTMLEVPCRRLRAVPPPAPLSTQ